MTHYQSRSRLSRQELYSYGFKEGQPWAEDRHALESALHAMDKLERDIQDNYIYGRPGPTSNPYASAAATPRHMSGSMSGSYFSPGRYPTPDIRMARSDASDRASDISSTSAYSGRGYDYREPSVYRGGSQAGWHQTQPARSSSSSGRPQDFQSYSQPFYAPPPSRISPSISGSRHSRAAHEDPQARYSPAPGAQYYDYGSRAPSAAGSVHMPIDAPAQSFSPSQQMQLVAYDGGRADRHSDDSDDQHSYVGDATSPQWSMDATQGTAMSERVMSDSSSQGMYSEDSEATRSSGYVESYDVASHDEYRDFLQDDDDRDYMSDDVASNEGEYYSSGDEREYDGDSADDVYSDEGYSDSYDDESYGDSD